MTRSPRSSSWADSGAARGNPADMPPPVQFEDDNVWHIGKPDLDRQIAKCTPIPANGSDWWGDYIVDTGLTEDRYLKAVETKPSPGAKQVVHHAVTYLMQDDGTAGAGRPRRRLERRRFLNEYAVGKNGDIFPEGTGRLVKAGAKVRFNMHYPPDRGREAGSERGRDGVLSEGLRAEVLPATRRIRVTPRISTCRAGDGQHPIRRLLRV